MRFSLHRPDLNNDTGISIFPMQAGCNEYNLFWRKLLDRDVSFKNNLLVSTPANNILVEV